MSTEAPRSINAGHTVADGVDPTKIVVDGKRVPVPHVLILRRAEALLVKREDFDQIVMLNGHDSSAVDEAAVRKETTFWP